MQHNLHNPAETTVLVTGIGGFLAGHIALQLLQKGYRVRGTVRDLARSAAIEQRLKKALGRETTGLSFVAADLLHDKGWDQAVAACTYVIHAASPFPDALPKHEDELIRPAREGSLRVLQAAQRAGVSRVVLTSSIAATNYGQGQAPYTEEDWTDVEGPTATPYYKSKTLAEQAAWVYARESGLELAVINPSLMLGPLLDKKAGTSVEIVRKLLCGEFPALPRFGISVVDVRDVADIHLRAMLAPEAAGQRFIAGGRFMWMSELAAILRAEFPAYAHKLPRRTLPDWFVRIYACFDAQIRLILKELGRDRTVDATKARNVLGWQPRREEEAIRASAQSLIDFGLVPAAGRK